MLSFAHIGINFSFIWSTVVDEVRTSISEVKGYVYVPELAKVTPQVVAL